jgi:hypothetical protein
MYLVGKHTLYVVIFQRQDYLCCGKEINIMYNFWKIVLLCFTDKETRVISEMLGVDVKLRKLKFVKIYFRITATVKRKVWKLKIR